MSSPPRGAVPTRIIRRKIEAASSEFAEAYDEGRFSDAPSLSSRFSHAIIILKGM